MQRLARHPDLPSTPSAATVAERAVNPHGAARDAPTDPHAPCWNSDELLLGTREALIRHDGATYRLRRTALGKLILTK